MDPNWPLPETVSMIPVDLLICRTRRLPRSPIHKLPLGSTIKPSGVFSGADLEGRPSPQQLGLPLGSPAIRNAGRAFADGSTVLSVIRSIRCLPRLLTYRNLAVASYAMCVGLQSRPLAAASATSPETPQVPFPMIRATTPLVAI